MAADVPPDSTYLGDSVYARVDGGDLELFTWNGYPDDPRNLIVLEPTVFLALLRFMGVARSNVAP